MNTKPATVPKLPHVGGVPGASARREAAKLRDAAPVRTRLARLLGVHTDERAWRVGADGEERVARYLSKLPPEWTVLHDLPLPRSDANIDHLVIGPGGLFSINSKNHPGGKVWVGSRMIMVNGHRTAYLPKARGEAVRVEKLLSHATGTPVSVRPVIALLGATLTIKERPADVAVIEARHLVRGLRARNQMLSAQVIDMLGAAARLRSTWS